MKTIDLEKSKQETMTVKELINELKKFPEDLPVITEGCDCYGPALRVIKDDIENVVEIRRYY